jgi:hypothetical protein
VSFGLCGQRWTRRWFKRIPSNDGRYNDLINTAIATVGSKVSRVVCHLLSGWRWFLVRCWIW